MTSLIPMFFSISTKGVSVSGYSAFTDVIVESSSPATDENSVTFTRVITSAFVSFYFLVILLIVIFVTLILLFALFRKYITVDVFITIWVMMIAVVFIFYAIISLYGKESNYYIGNYLSTDLVSSGALTFSSVFRDFIYCSFSR